MTKSLRHVEDVLDLLGRVDASAIRREHEKLRAIHAWAMRQIGVDYTVGDRVAIADRVVSKTTTPGWWCYREALAPGATAVVTEIDFSPRADGGAGAWVARIRLDREWSVHSFGRCDASDSRKHVFTVRADALRAHSDPQAGVE